MGSSAFFIMHGVLSIGKSRATGAEEGAGRIESAIMRRPVGGGGFYGKRCVL